MLGGVLLQYLIGRHCLRDLTSSQLWWKYKVTRSTYVKLQWSQTGHQKNIPFQQNGFVINQTHSDSYSWEREIIEEINNAAFSLLSKSLERVLHKRAQWPLIWNKLTRRWVYKYVNEQNGKKQTCPYIRLDSASHFRSDLWISEYDP